MALAQLLYRLRDLRPFPLGKPERDALRAAGKALPVFKDENDMDALRGCLAQLQDLRNALARGAAKVPEIEDVQPAYSLDEDEDD